ncbi:MAG: precorrin-8X methylmutase [SAR202 cluster bacterium]|nr:precorrin-8X methylmutase [SAR202 cluster bacterium]
MSLVQKYALLPDEIDRQSLQMVEASLPSSLGFAHREHYVVCRIVRAEGDPDIATSVRFSPGAVAKGLAALAARAPVLTDVRMVEAGISRALLQRHGIATRCLIDAPQVAERARREGTTRSVAALRELQPQLNGAVVAIGNAPTALLALLDMVDAGEALPALIIGMPVGFVACPESKEELMRRQTPYISIQGRRGGSSAAAATVNALLDLLSGQGDK